jgi:hypothetical protein
VAGALDAEWERLGRPDPFVVVEAGAGSGALAGGARQRARLRRRRCATCARSGPPPSGPWRSSACRSSRQPTCSAGWEEDDDDVELVVGAGSGPVVARPRRPAGDPLHRRRPRQRAARQPAVPPLQRRGSGWDEVRVGVDGDELVEVPVAAGDELATRRSAGARRAGRGPDPAPARGEGVAGSGARAGPGRAGSSSSTTPTPRRPWRCARGRRGSGPTGARARRPPARGARARPTSRATSPSTSSPACGHRTSTGARRRGWRRTASTSWSPRRAPTWQAGGSRRRPCPRSRPAAASARGTRSSTRAASAPSGCWSGRWADRPAVGGAGSARRACHARRRWPTTRSARAPARCGPGRAQPCRHRARLHHLGSGAGARDPRRPPAWRPTSGCRSRPTPASSARCSPASRWARRPAVAWRTAWTRGCCSDRRSGRLHPRPRGGSQAWTALGPAVAGGGPGGDRADFAPHRLVPPHRVSAP